MDSIQVNTKYANLQTYGYFTTKDDMNASEALEYTNKHLLQRLPNNALSLGFDNQTYWYRFDLNNTKDSYFYIGNPVATSCELFVFDSNKLISHQINGYNVPIQDREIDAFSIMFKVPNAKSNLVLLLKVQSVNPMFTAFSFDSYENIYTEDFKYLAIQIATISICFAMIIYYLLIYFITKDLINIYYCFYVAAFYCLNFILSGMLAFLSIPPLIENMPILVAISIILFDISISLFSINFLDLNKYSKKLKRVVLYSLAVAIISVLLIPVGNGLEKFAVVGIYLNCFVLIFAGLYSYFKFKNKSALIYFFATGVSIAICIVYMLMSQGYFVPYNFLTFNILSIGVIWDVILLSLALAYRIKQLMEQNSKLEQEKNTNEKFIAIGEAVDGIASQWRQLIDELNYILMFLKSKQKSKDITQEDINEAVNDQEVVLNKMLNIISGFQGTYQNDSKNKFYLKEIVSEAIHQLGLLFNEQNLSIINNVKDDLQIASDKNKLFEALLVLINSSIHFAKESEAAKSIVTIDANIKNGKMLITIDNNGAKVKSAAEIFNINTITSQNSNDLLAAKRVIENDLNAIIAVEKNKNGIRFSVVIN